MRIRHKINLQASLDTAGRDKLFGLDDALAEVVLDGFTEVSSGTVTLAAAALFTIPFASIADVRGLFLRATNDFKLAVNGGPQVTFRRGLATPGTGYASSCRALLEAALSGAVVEAINPLTLVYCAWGDPA